MLFRPIAIVGRACVLPGALNPEGLWDVVRHGRVLTGPAPRSRWRLPAEQVLASDAPERSYHDRGGYVTGFESVFDPHGFEVPASEVQGLDALTRWVLHTGREALREVRGAADQRERVGAVLGNLSLPSEGLTAFAERVWLEEQAATIGLPAAAELAELPAPPAEDRFMSGFPALYLAKALGLGAGAIALDAACASSLYAIKLACDRLADGTADVMLAGAVNRADDLFLHMGFTALQALSPTGRSRPFHRAADGLLPAEGAAFVALKRLEDAQRDGDRIFGVLRGVGLSNDGRATGLLVPDSAGQERALIAAYAQAGWTPGTVGMVECHATGTAIGDATELATLSRVFAGCQDVPIGSIKGNLGHPITVAGLAGLLKILGAFEHGLRPPGIPVDDPNPALADTPFRLLQQPDPWPAGLPRRAALSAFGFGGNNAHLLVEAWEPDESAVAPSPAPQPPLGAIAVVGLGARVGDGDGRDDFLHGLFGESGPLPTARALELPARQLRFPPADLLAALPQQLWVLATAEEAVAEVQPVARERVGTYVGMQCDPAIARYGLRWRLKGWLDQWVRRGEVAPFADAWLLEAKDQASPSLTAAGVLGTLPNVVANRLNSQFDWGGLGFAVSAEELSGLAGLDLACRALRARELDMAVVGAVDMATDPVQARAAQACLPPDRHRPGDAAVVLVLKRLADAEAAGDTIWAVLPDGLSRARPDWSLALDEAESALTRRFGHAHAASGLLHVAAAVAACHHRVRPLADGPGVPLLAAKDPVVQVTVTGMADSRVQRLVAAVPQATARPVVLRPLPRLYTFAGQHRAALRAALAAGSPASADAVGPDDGPLRLVLVASDEREFAQRQARALTWLDAEEDLSAPRMPLPEGLAFAQAPLGGEVAALFGGAASAYAGMGRELFMALPELGEGLRGAFPGVGDAAGWMFDERRTGITPLEKLWGASALAQAHAVVTRRMLGIPFQATLGLSSGETNALYAFEAWHDMGALRQEFEAAEVFTRHLGGACETLQTAWQGMGLSHTAWANWRVSATADEVRALLPDVPFVSLTTILGPKDVIIGGLPEACRRLITALGGVVALPLEYDVAVHSEEVRHYADAWRALHRRPTSPVPGVRFYTHATGRWYEPTADSAADALLGQALKTIDFPALVEAAYADGVRVFVEHGPQAGLAPLVRQILGDRPHLAVSLDMQSQPSLRQLANACAALLAAGVPVDWPALCRRWSPTGVAATPPAGPAITFLAHRPPLAWSALPRSAGEGRVRLDMPQAPALPSVLGHWSPRELPRVDAASAGRPLAVPPVDPPAPASAETLAREAASAPASLPAAQVAKDLPPSRGEPPPTRPTGGLVEPGLSVPLNPPVPLPMQARTHVTQTTSSATPASATPPAAPVTGTAQDAAYAYFLARQREAQVAYAHLLAQQAAVHQQYLNQSSLAFQALVRRLQGGGVAGQMSVSAPMSVPLTAPSPSLGAWHAPATPALPVDRPVSSPEPAALAPAELAPEERAPVAPTAIASPPAAPAAEPAAGLPVGSASGVATTPGLPNAPVVRPQPAAAQPAVAAASTAEAAVSLSSASMPAPSAPPRSVLPAGRAERDVPSGPSFDRQQLEVLASGKISDVFGPLFAQQDGFHRQVRMPEPPLLLADRVTGIRGEAGSMKTGTIWTETDVRWDSWYLHQGRMPAGIMVESGQADLLMISWLGADFLNRGERVYRLLGCELTYHASPETGYEVLPKPGETLVYDIHVDGHAKQGDVRLFFFHYDCNIGGHPRLTVRHGQAGFFTDEELAGSSGVLWDPLEAMPEGGRVDAPRALSSKRRFELADIEAFADGNLLEAFGAGFEAALSHVRSPRMSGGAMRFFDTVTDFDPQGGPWGRGYLRATADVTPDDWFFKGHFKNDPCMPGTLMFEGTLQTMALYLSALGFGLDKDGWRFEPVPEATYHMRCRGQVTPAARHLVYEVFVEELHDGEFPTLWADLLVTVDGLKAFHCRRMGLRLVPGFPMEAEQDRMEVVDRGAVAVQDGFAFGQRSLWACAWGKPSMAFGPQFKGFDAGKRLPRLPGPPYHFMTRIASLDGQLGEPRLGSTIVAEYDIPSDAWYFQENGHPTMPFAVLLEAALQPCGWLASFVGTPLRAEQELFFRNLDGTSTLRRELAPDDGTLATRVTLTKSAQSAGMVIVGFDVRCTLPAQDDALVFEMNTVFGFFPGAALASQVGIPPTPEEAAVLVEPSDFRVDLLRESRRYRAPAIATDRLRLLDRVTGWWPEGGQAGLGRARAEKDVDPGHWYFKAHFFQDPVQPGSLGLEAMIQLLQIAMVEKGLAAGVRHPRFESIGVDLALTWKYRGQVVPTARTVVVELEFTRIGEDERGAYAVADSWLWVDGMRIYGATGLGMRVVAGDPPPVRDGVDEAAFRVARNRLAADAPQAEGGPAEELGTNPELTASLYAEDAAAAEPTDLAVGQRGPDSSAEGATGVSEPASDSEEESAGPVSTAPPMGPDDEELDPERDTWLQDHKPTYVLPVLPFMSLLDRIVGAARALRPRAHVVRLTNVQVLKWVALPGGTLRLRRAVETQDDGTLAVTISRWWDAPNPVLSRFEPVATATVEMGEDWLEAPAAWLPPDDAQPQTLPYADGEMFHGPVFQVMESWALGSYG
ncbi:MAG: beta-ketoacyl synthase N-terminal-like domain-containing protein, partial [Candidatus Sericytochromatia bacterium]|nr:beta-ketoacyl synthase N-terminal-like domain-containing protein [Candidatus Sericytochromatia bacterium]